MKNPGAGPNRLWAWSAILYGAFVFLTFGFLSVMVLVLAISEVGAAACMIGSLFVGFPLAIGGVLVLRSNRTAEIWWMICGGASLIWVVVLPSGTSTVFMIPALAAGAYAAVQRFGKR